MKDYNWIKYVCIAFWIILLILPSRGQSPTTYFYVVTAVDSAGNESPFSNQATCSPISPATPHCDLSWTASTTTGVSGYNVRRSTVSGSGYIKVNTSLVTTLTYSDLPVAFPNPPTGVTAAPGAN